MVILTGEYTCLPMCTRDYCKVNSVPREKGLTICLITHIGRKGVIQRAAPAAVTYTFNYCVTAKCCKRHKILMKLKGKNVQMYVCGCDFLAGGQDTPVLPDCEGLLWD